MVGLFASARKKAAERAITGLRPLFGMLQTAMGPGIPPDMWRDPYILGFLNVGIGYWAKFVAGDKLSVEDLGYATFDTLTALSHMNAHAIADQLTKYAMSKNSEYLRGQNNATTYYRYADGRLKDEATNPLVVAAAEELKGLAGQRGRDDIGGNLLRKIWLQEVKRVAQAPR